MQCEWYKLAATGNNTRLWGMGVYGGWGRMRVMVVATQKKGTFLDGRIQVRAKTASSSHWGPPIVGSSALRAFENTAN